MCQRSLRALIGVACVGISGLSTQAAPILIHIYDYDFTIQTDTTAALYDYRGTAADTLSITSAAATTKPGVPSYMDFSGGFATPAPGSGTINGAQYPVWSRKGGEAGPVFTTPFTYSGLLDLDMTFGGSDGPYNNGTDLLVSLTGTTGHVKITGFVGYAPPGDGTTANITLLEMDLTDISLMARPGDTVAKVTGKGTVTKLFGQTPEAGFTSAGLVTFDYGTATGLFGNSTYTPAVNLGGTAMGYLSGEAGVGEPGSGVPEPASLGLLGLGAAGLLLRRRR